MVAWLHGHVMYQVAMNWPTKMTKLAWWHAGRKQMHLTLACSVVSLTCTIWSSGSFKTAEHTIFYRPHLVLNKPTVQQLRSHVVFPLLSSGWGYCNRYPRLFSRLLKVSKSRKQFMVKWILQKNERWVSALEDYYFKVNTKRESMFFLQEDRLSFVLKYWCGLYSFIWAFIVLEDRREPSQQWPP